MNVKEVTTKIKDIEVWIMEYDKNGELIMDNYKLNKIPKEKLNREVMETVLCSDNSIEIYIM